MSDVWNYNKNGEIVTNIVCRYFNQDRSVTNYAYKVITAWTMLGPYEVSWQISVDGDSLGSFDFDTYAPLNGTGKHWSESRKAHDAVLALLMG